MQRLGILKEIGVKERADVRSLTGQIKQNGGEKIFTIIPRLDTPNTAGASIRMKPLEATLRSLGLGASQNITPPSSHVSQTQQNGGCGMQL